RKRAEEGLLEMSERFRTLAESSLIGVYLIQDGLFQYVNPVLARMFGYTVEELVGRLGPADLVHPEDRPQVEENVRRRVEGTTEEIRYELRGLRKDGSLFPVEVHGRRIELRGKVGVMGALLDNTERKLAEQELRTSEARFRALIEHAGASFMLFDQKGMVVEVNRAACESLGYTREELIGMTPVDFGVRVTAADMARRRALVNSGETLRFESFHRRKDGSLFPVEVRVRSAGVESGYAIALAQDITERRRNEKRVTARQRVTQTLAEARTLEEAAPRLLAAIADGLDWDVGELWRIDPERGVLRLVESWDRAAGAASPFETAGREVPLLRGQGLPGRVWLAGETIWIPDVVKEPSLLHIEELRALGLHAGLGVPILLGGEVRGIVVLFSTEVRDPDPEVLDFLSGIASQIVQFIERKRAEEGLNDARAQLTHLTRVMTMGELTAAIAHELKQPLASLAAAASASRHWLQREPPDLREVEECLDQVSSDARRAGEVLDRIRSMVARSPPSKTRLDLNQTLEEVVALSQSEADRHRIVVRTSLSAGLPPVLGDRVQIQQVVLNLVLNGIRAMATTTGRPRELSMRSKRVGNEVVVEVEDRGVGVRPEDLDRIFEPFFTTKSDGLGVGLAISRRIIEDHGGRLWATANEGAGTIFRFTVPADAARGVSADAPGAAHG
ncbi:MAG TPA: PAS domain S-box protein, partial [Myxococcaceae bacterium]|nr:PAS domain S-box protein [Myxococcaceae bacterium]